jgi:hypothetical protein
MWTQCHIYRNTKICRIIVLQPRGFQIIATGNNYLKLHINIISICLKHKSRYLMENILKCTIPAYFTFQVGVSPSLPQTARTSAATSILHACDPPGGSHSMTVAVKGNVNCTLSTASYTELGIRSITLRCILLL